MEIIAGVTAVVGAAGGVTGFVAWRRSRVDIAGQLETYWAAAVKREHQLHEELMSLQDELAAARKEARAAVAEGDLREKRLLAQIAELSAQLQHARAEVAELRAELAQTRADVASASTSTEGPS